MQLHDALDDGKPEARAGNLGAERPVKALEDALALVGGDAGAAVCNGNDGAFSLGGDADFNAPALGRVADGVVGEVGDEKPQGVGHAGECCRGGVHGERDALAFGDGLEIGVHREGKLFEPDFAHRLLCLGIEARDGEELLHKARCAGNALLQTLGVLRAVFVGLCAREELPLQLDGGKRSSEFMRRVRGKALLSGEAHREALHQRIDGMHERAHFARQPRALNGLKRGG